MQRTAELNNIEMVDLSDQAIIRTKRKAISLLNFLFFLFADEEKV